MEQTWCGYDENNRTCAAKPDHDGPHVLRTWQESLCLGLVTLVLAGGLR